MSQLNYMQGVERAQKEGLIVGKEQYNPFFDHIELYDESVTRPLKTEVKQFLKDVPHGGKVLELGAGSGFAAGEVSILRPDVVIHTSGLTPINPFLRLRRNAIEHQHDYRTIQALLDIQNNSRKKVVDILKKPFIQKQFIGYFPGCFGKKTEEYNLIYEYMGPTLHLGNPKLYRSAAKLLDPSGVALFYPLRSGVDIGRGFEALEDRSQTLLHHKKNPRRAALVNQGFKPVE